MSALHIERWIVLGCWCAQALYWLLMRFSVKPTKERTRAFQGVWFWGGRVLFVLLLAAGFGLHQFHLLSMAVLPSIPHLRHIGVVCVVIGTVVAILARKTIAGNWSGHIEIKEDHELITSGIYGYVRHPIYTGFLLMGLGTFLVIPRVIILVFVLYLSCHVLFKLREEELLLSRHFPTQYAEYRQRTKALIPFVW